MSAVGQVLASWFAGVEVFVATPIRRAVAQKRRISVAHSSTCTTFINSNVASGRAIAACTSPSCLLPGKDLAGARPPAAPVWPPTGHSSPLAPGCHAHKYPGTLVEVSRCPLKLPRLLQCSEFVPSSCWPLHSCPLLTSDQGEAALGRRDGLARGAPSLSTRGIPAAAPGAVLPLLVPSQSRLLDCGPHSSMSVLALRPPYQVHTPSSTLCSSQLPAQL